MERRAAIVTASVVSAAVLAASGLLAGASGLFDRAPVGADPVPTVDTSIAPDDVATTLPVEPEVVTVVVDQPAPSSTTTAVAPITPAVPVPLAVSTVDDHGGDRDDDDDHEDDDHEDDDHEDEDDHEDDDDD